MTAERPVTLIYIGTLVPDTNQFEGPAFSRAGNLFQYNLLCAMIQAGLFPALVLSQRPVRLYPQSSMLWQRPAAVTIDRVIEARLVPFCNLPILRPLTVGGAIALRIWRCAREHRGTDLVVYTFNLTEPPGLFTWLAARLVGARLVASVNDVNVPGHLVPASWQRRADYSLQKLLLPSFDALVVVSDRIASDLAPNVPALRVEGGVTPEMLEVGERRLQRQCVESRPFTIVSAGSLDEFNGVSEILEAMRHLPGGGYRLRIAGSGPLLSLVEAAAREDPRIEYCGYLALEKVLGLYATADALVNMRITRRLNTLYFFPSKLMEYLASGVPLITTCPAHVREEFSDFVYMIEEESAEALAREIAAVARLPAEERDAKARAAWEFVARHRTWAVQGRRIVAFIRKMLE